jgi:phosphatidylethanolamine/phosphatidyl-N-methylethanolamine N-methyltransferase
VVNAEATDLTAVLAEQGITHADAIVSGLPWVAYRPSVPATLAAALVPSGVLTQFAYTWSRWAPPARAELAMLRQHFGQIDISPTIWLNLPPAVVYRARLPATAEPD